MIRFTGFLVFAVCLGVSFSTSSSAQLADCAQINENGNVNAPLGCIEKSLQQQIGAGQGDEFTPGSSIYLIKRDPARSIRRGRQLFQRKFTAAQGHGPRVNATSAGDITQTRALGAGLADSCAACHGRPKGSAGHGGDVVTRPDSRDAPHLFGLGLVEQLADEMTQELRAIRQQALQEAIGGGSTISFATDNSPAAAVSKELVSKGVHFGTISALPDGSVDTSQVVGVDTDLRIRPFFAQGETISIREFIIGAFKDEMGLQAWDPILCSVTDPNNPQTTISPAGFIFDPALDDFERPAICSATADNDNDGITNEIDPALVDHLEFYLLNYFKPGQYKTTPRTEQGLRLMDSIGCTSCHVQDFVVNADRRVADIETQYDPQRGIFNQLFATATTLFEPVDDGEEFSQLLPKEESFLVKDFFSDLKRHDLGPAFHERDYDGTLLTEFVTEPLWGVGTTAPYGHDGRSINLDAVIRRHGGEAESAKQGYTALSDNNQRKIQEFLQSLVLFPPDDTASNLNPGNPGSLAPQDPAEHGSINLSELFQIDSEGGE